MTCKFLVPLLAAVLAGCAGVPMASSAGSGALPPAGAVSVAWASPDTYREQSCRYSSAERGSGWVRTLALYTRAQAEKRLTPEARLEIHFTDIDRAGECEPLIGRAQDIRMVRSIYPPRLQLHYRLEANGVVREEDATLSDLAFQMGASPVNDSDPLRYEKRTIDDWLRRLLPR